MKKINVISLFDGMSCGRIALSRTPFEVENYYSSEIDKHAIKVADDNWTDDTKNRLGSVTDITEEQLEAMPKIDLLIGGSPCQGFSFAGKELGASTKCNKIITTLEQYLTLKEQGFEFNGQSYLFWEYMRILTTLRKKNPNILFLLENVLMQDKWAVILTEAVGVEPIMIDSTLVSAQVRKRLYWTNIENVEQPSDRGILLTDILETNDYPNKATILGRRLDERGKRQDYDKSIPILQCLEVRASNREKSNCLTTVAKDCVMTTLPIGRHPDAYGKISGTRLPFRDYTSIERERLQTVPDNYTDCVSDNQRGKMLGNGWTVDVIAHILNYIEVEDE